MCTMWASCVLHVILSSVCVCVWGGVGVWVCVCGCRCVCVGVCMISSSVIQCLVSSLV